MNIGLIISHKYPNTSPVDDYTVSQEPGEEPKLTHWNEAKFGPRPTDQQLQDAWLPALKGQKRNELILAADADYRAIFTRDGQYVELEKDYLLLRRSFGLALTPLQQDQAQQARAVVEKLQVRLQAVYAAATEAEVEGIKWRN